MGSLLKFVGLLVLVAGGSEGVSLPPVASVCTVQWTPSTAVDIFDDIIHKSDYKKDVRPFNASSDVTGAQATNVRVSFYVVNMDALDEVNGHIDLQMYFRQSWNDPRLSYQSSHQYRNLCNEKRPEKLSLPASMLDDIWRPDSFIVQALKGSKHDLLQPERFARVSPDGTVQLSERVTVTLACPQFAESELAKKECIMNIESYGGHDEEITFDWKDKNPVHFEENGFVPKKHKLDKITTLRCDAKVPSSNLSYSCIQAKFSFSKKPEITIQV